MLCATTTDQGIHHRVIDKVLLTVEIARLSFDKVKN